MPKYRPFVPHYNQGNIQPVDFFEGWYPKDHLISHYEMEIIKYVCRHRYKGSPQKDLQKAMVYLTWIGELEEEQ